MVYRETDKAGFKPLKGFSSETAYDFSVSIYGRDIHDVWSLDSLYGESLAFDLEKISNNYFADKCSLLSWLCAQVSSSPNGSAMLMEAIEDDWSLAIEDIEGPDFHIDVPEKLIILDNAKMSMTAFGRSEYFRHVLLVSFVRALRDVWQERRHGGFDEDYAPADIIMLERIRAADLDVMAVLVAWEIRADGYGGLWRYMIGSEDGDLAMRFSGYMERNPSSAFDMRALHAAFEQWFKNSARVTHCEHEILNELDVIIEDNADGGRVFGHEKLMPIKIESLSCMPDKTAYLHHLGADIMRDPQYAGMVDEVNQAHFMQILHDMQVVRVQGVPFRDKTLADKIFPKGLMSCDEVSTR